MKPRYAYLCRREIKGRHVVSRVIADFKRAINVNETIAIGREGTQAQAAVLIRLSFRDFCGRRFESSRYVLTAIIAC